MKKNSKQQQASLLDQADAPARDFLRSQGWTRCPHGGQMYWKNPLTSCLYSDAEAMRIAERIMEARVR
jgi:hypothetical protein